MVLLVLEVSGGSGVSVARLVVGSWVLCRVSLFLEDG